jgi:FkbM family methyltransferase
MKLTKVTFPKKFNLQELEVWHDFDLKMLRQQSVEIFKQGHYKKGLRKEDMTVIDCGASIGLASLFFQPHAKTVYAIEPNPSHYECLIKNTEKFSNIKTFNFAMANQTGQDYLCINDNGDYAESFFGNGEKKDLVPLKDMETFFNENNIEHVDVLKIDTEGAEYSVLPSVKFGNVASKIDFIIGEAHTIGGLPETIPQILLEYGFKTKFLPIKNYYQKHLYFDPSGVVKEYKVQHNTIFVAERL